MARQVRNGAGSAVSAVLSPSQSHVTPSDIAYDSVMQIQKSFPNEKLVRVIRDQRVQVWALVLEKEWSGAYVGENEFVFSDDQISELRHNGIDVEVLS